MEGNQKPAEQEKLAREVLARLRSRYPDAGPRLIYSSPYQALVAIMLSAQTTDEQVNRVTPRLFARYPDTGALAEAEVEEVAGLIKSVGLYRSKAAHLVATARQITGEYGGRIPTSLDELVKLPGVGRKTANVLLAGALGKPGLGVDTHVYRVANRVGLAAAKTPAGTEQQLKEIIPMEDWGNAHHLLIFHGRNTCRAKKPDCAGCILKDLCRWHHTPGLSEKDHIEN